MWCGCFNEKVFGLSPKYRNISQTPDVRSFSMKIHLIRIMRIVQASHSIPNQNSGGKALLSLK